MKIAEGLKLVAGSTFVYAVVAACGAVNSTSPGFATNDEAGVSSSSSGSAGSSGQPMGDGAGGILDALTDPVSEAKADVTTSGTRLKAKYWVGTDGSKQFNTWHDSTLNADCNFVPASDRTVRCLPFANIGASVGSYFSDSGCTQSLVAVTKGCVAPPYTVSFVTNSVGATCSSGYSYFYRAWPVGSLYSGAIYSGTAANCAAVTGTTLTSVTTSSDLYVSAGETPPGNFVQATVQTDP